MLPINTSTILFMGKMQFWKDLQHHLNYLIMVTYHIIGMEGQRKVLETRVIIDMRSTVTCLPEAAFNALSSAMQSLKTVFKCGIGLRQRVPTRVTHLRFNYQVIIRCGRKRKKEGKFVKWWR